MNVPDHQPALGLESNGTAAERGGRNYCWSCSGSCQETSVSLLTKRLCRVPEMGRASAHFIKTLLHFSRLPEERGLESRTHTR